MRYWIAKAIGGRGIPLGLLVLSLTSSGLSGCSTKREIKPILVLEREGEFMRYEANKPIPSKPYPQMVGSVEEYKKVTDPR